MCGISGFVDFNRLSDFNILRSMTDRLVHRGPDDGGYFFENLDCAQIGLGHRRLSILDLSSLGKQPLNFEHLKMVYNGEIYNFKEIKYELELDNYSFYSNSDSEVILKAYHKWGNSVVEKFNGMFVIVIYDAFAKNITFIRDRAGVKPLYWYFHNGLFLFSSELKSFHIHPKFEKKLDFNSLSLYFEYGYVPEPHTIFDYSYKLKAGNIMTLNLENREISNYQYWNVLDLYSRPKLKISEEEVLEETERLLQSACNYRMLSDVPIGVFLSGGYDSSTVAALVQNNSSEKIKTFSIGFKDSELNESEYAKSISNYLGTDHTEYFCTSKDAFDVIVNFGEIFDEPISDSSCIPTYLVSKLARKDVAVSLSADGGDEIFGGYSKYTNILKVYSKFKNIPFKPKIHINFYCKNIRQCLEYYDKNLPKKINLFSKIFSASSVVDALNIYQKIYSKREINDLFIRDRIDHITNFNFDAFQFSDMDFLDQLMAIDYKTYQQDNILMKVDRASMAVSLEGREPLLDFRLIDFLSQVDPKLKIYKGEKKYLLKSIAHKYIPKSLLDRPKMGFDSPISDWISSDLNMYIDLYLSKDFLKKQNIFNVQIVSTLLLNFRNGDRALLSKLWVIIIFQIWYAKWMI